MNPVHNTGVPRTGHGMASVVYSSLRSYCPDRIAGYHLLDHHVLNYGLIVFRMYGAGAGTFCPELELEPPGHFIGPLKYTYSQKQYSTGMKPTYSCHRRCDFYRNGRR